MSNKSVIESYSTAKQLMELARERANLKHLDHFRNSLPVNLNKREVALMCVLFTLKPSQDLNYFDTPIELIARMLGRRTLSVQRSLSHLIKQGALIRVDRIDGSIAYEFLLEDHRSVPAGHWVKLETTYSLTPCPEILNPAFLSCGLISYVSVTGDCVVEIFECDGRHWADPFNAYATLPTSCGRNPPIGCVMAGYGTVVNVPGFKVDKDLAARVQPLPLIKRLKLPEGRKIDSDYNGWITQAPAEPWATVTKVHEEFVLGLFREARDQKGGPVSPWEVFERAKLHKLYPNDLRSLEVTLNLLTKQKRLRWVTKVKKSEPRTADRDWKVDF